MVHTNAKHKMVAVKKSVAGGASITDCRAPPGPRANDIFSNTPYDGLARGA
jgi:hypothetical protein